jgi:lantibiotic modifying enzyme
MQPPSMGFLDTADFIGAQLSRDAIWSGHRCNWYGIAVTQTHRATQLEAQSVCGSDFYSGTTGIALFLAQLFAATGEKIFRMTAEGAIRQALSRLDHFPPECRISFYAGLTGVAYSLFEIAESCGIEKFNDIGLLVMEEIAGDDTSACDAATVNALVRMHQRHQRDYLLRLALRCGDELLERAGERNSNQSQKNTTNVASAMVELSKLTGENKYREMAEEILCDESSSSGASGGDEISLTRAHLRAFELLGQEIYSKCARENLQAIELRTDPLSDGYLDFTLARGLAGKADTVLEAGRILGDEHLRETAERVGNWGIEQYKKNDLPWPCGSTARLDSPSFMVGVAGIGYFYLRLYDPSQVPSVLFA